MIKRLQDYLWAVNHRLLAKKVADGRATDYEVDLLETWDKVRGK